MGIPSAKKQIDKPEWPKTELNPAQKEAAFATNEPLLIVAGAGTGKTKTLTTRIAYLIKEGVHPSKICALTFTNKAAQEMLERVGKLTNLQTGGNLKHNSPYIGTFHSLGARILREAGHFLGREPNFAIFDDNDSFKLIKKIIKESNEKDLKPADLSSKISAIKNGMAKPAKIERREDWMVSQSFAEYEKKLMQNNAFDFDDLIQKVVLIFKTKPEVLARYQNRFSHFLVDEYQDINDVQYEMVKLLADREKNLSVVGDHNQTIYSWRGSNLEIFLNFERDWAGSRLIFLGENYRSTQKIIAAASELIKNNLKKPAGLKEDALWTNNSEGEQIVLKEAQDEIEEANWIASEIRKLKAKSEKCKIQNEKQEESEVGDSQIAILYRTNAQSRAIEQALIEHEIPYQIFGGLKFYERREIKDVVSALRYISNPADEISRERLEKLLRKAGFIRFEKELAGKNDWTPTKIIEGFLKVANYFEYLDKNFTNPEERRENIMELLSFASAFEKVDEFLERMSLLQAMDNVEENKNLSVKLMTMHLAKGLEFENIFVAGATEGLLPHHRAMGNTDELEEERRLLYVAMTRAKTRLFLSFYDLPSRFLSEIPQELMRFSGGMGLEDEERYITLD
ncbi:MAG: UvrD-helicase domain-containing protein [Patescibacteria group bacterium]